MHAGSFFANRRRRAQNGPAWRRSAAWNIILSKFRFEFPGPNWDTRIPSMGLHYIAAFLDPSLKNLRSLVDYMESREDTMSEFIISIITEMGNTMKQLCPEEQPASEKQPADPEVKEIDPPTPASSECEAPKENPSRLENPSTLKQKLGLGPKERQFEAKRQKIDLIKRFSMPAASKDAKSISYRLRSPPTKVNWMIWTMISFYTGRKGRLLFPFLVRFFESFTAYQLLVLK